MKHFLLCFILLLSLVGCNASKPVEDMYAGIKTVHHTELCLSTIKSEIKDVSEGYYFIRDTDDNAYFYIYSKSVVFEQMSVSNQMIDNDPQVVFTATTKNLVYHYDEPHLDGFMAMSVNDQVASFKFMVDGYEVNPQYIESRLDLRSAR